MINRLYLTSTWKFTAGPLICSNSVHVQGRYVSSCYSSPCFNCIDRQHQHTEEGQW